MAVSTSQPKAFRLCTEVSYTDLCNSPGDSAALSWTVYSNGCANISTELVPSTLPKRKGYMMHVVINGGYSGIVQWGGCNAPCDLCWPRSPLCRTINVATTALHSPNRKAARIAAGFRKQRCVSQIWAPGRHGLRLFNVVLPGEQCMRLIDGNAPAFVLALLPALQHDKIALTHLLRFYP